MKLEDIKIAVNKEENLSNQQRGFIIDEILKFELSPTQEELHNMSDKELVIEYDNQGYQYAMGQLP